MTLRNLVSYWTVLGLAFQSGRLEQSMNVKLVKMGTAAERATQLEAAADRDTALAAENEEKSGIDATEGETLEQEAAVLAAESKQDEALAATDQAAADELTAEAAEEEEQAVNHFAQAAADETLAEEEFAGATAEAAEASETEATAHGEEIGTGVCEFIPFLDFICDIVGGTAAVGLEVTAANEAAEAAAGFAASATAKAQEESELTVAGELQAKAAEDAEAAAEVEAQADALEAKAEEEAAQAEEEETLAEEKFEQSEMEEEAAEEETAEANEEHTESSSLWEESMRHGVGACWDLIMAGSVATVALGFFAFRIMASHVVPGATVFVFDYVPSVMHTRGTQGTRHMQILSNVWTSMPMKQFSLFFLHCAVFIMTAGVFGDLLSAMGNCKTRSRGGVILIFSAAAACFQGLLLHAGPHLLSLHTEGKRAPVVVVQVLLTFLQSILWLIPLFSIELLILWVNFGDEIFSPPLRSSICTWYMWLIFVLATAAHFVLFEIQSSCYESSKAIEGECQTVLIDSEFSPLMKSKKGSAAKVALSYQSSDHVEEDMSAISMDDGLQCRCTKSTFATDLDVDTEQGAAKGTESLSNHSTISPTGSSSRQILTDLWKLRLPFEILIISCMVALLRSCIPNALRLLPLFSSVVVASHPSWYMPLISIGIASAICVALCILLCRPRQTRLLSETAHL